MTLSSSRCRRLCPEGHQLGLVRKATISLAIRSRKLLLRHNPGKTARSQECNRVKYGKMKRRHLAGTLFSVGFFIVCVGGSIPSGKLKKDILKHSVQSRSEGMVVVQRSCLICASVLN